MTVHTYRYQKQEPITQLSLRDEAGATTTLTDADGGDIQDITQDDATDALADLDDAMAVRGYIRIDTDPTTLPSSAFSPQGSSAGGSTSAIYRFSTITTAADPGTGRMRFNNAVYASVTAVYFDDTADSPSFDMGLIFETINPGDLMIVQQNDDSAKAVEFAITSVTDNTGWWTFAVTYIQDAGGALITNNRATTAAFIYEADHIKHNLAATVDPTTGDDSDDGYEVGSVWVNTTSDEAFLAVDVSVGAAVWQSITSSGGSLPTYLFPAGKLGNPLSADWAVNGLAPLAEDTNDDGLLVRLFDDTTEEGIGFTITIPSTAVSMQIFTLARAETTPGGAVVAKLLLYEREVSDGSAVTAWSSSIALTDVDLSTNEFFVLDETDKTVATWGVTAGKTHQFQLTRTSVSDTLSGDLALSMLYVEFTP